jgi:hypothetical protein
MNKTRYNAPEITTGLILKAPDIARIGIPNEHKEMCYYEWLSESTTVAHILNNTDICEEFYTEKIDDKLDENRTKEPSCRIVLFSKKLGKKDVPYAYLLNLLIEHAMIEGWEFNLSSLKDVAELLYVYLIQKGRTEIEEILTNFANDLGL